jgi:hypothetical protein
LYGYLYFRRQRVFIEQLERNDQTPEWQVRQAARAVELFQKHYVPPLRKTRHS